MLFGSDPQLRNARLRQDAASLARTSQMSDDTPPGSRSNRAVAPGHEPGAADELDGGGVWFRLRSASLPGFCHGNDNMHALRAKAG
jgi:hypothetical protein